MPDEATSDETAVAASPEGELSPCWVTPSARADADDPTRSDNSRFVDYRVLDDPVHGVASSLDEMVHGVGGIFDGLDDH